MCSRKSDVINVSKTEIKHWRSMDFDFDPGEWNPQAEINKYKVWRMDSDYTFPDLYMNDENRKYGEDLYVFNAIDFPNHKQRQKVLSHFYQLCDLMFGEVISCLSEPETDLFYDERHFEGMRMSMKFCSDIQSSESQNFEFICNGRSKKCLKIDLSMSLLAYFLVEK